MVIIKTKSQDRDTNKYLLGRVILYNFESISYGICNKTITNSSCLFFYFLEPNLKKT